MAKKGKRKAAAGDVATNRQAAFRFNLLERLEAGIVLQGSEVKSLRNGSVQIKDAYAEVSDGEVWLRNMHIAPYEPAREGHDPERPRKLLLHKREIERLIGKTAEKGLTIVPMRVYFKGPRAKVELAVATGKQTARQTPCHQGPGHEARDRPRAERALALGYVWAPAGAGADRARRGDAHAARCAYARGLPAQAVRALEPDPAIGGPARQLVAAGQLELAQHRRHVRLHRLG